MIKDKKINFYISLLLIVLIFVIFVFNYLNYDPIYGYDAEAHYEYVEGFFALLIPNLSDQASDEITSEFFSPPLPYAVPAIFSFICKNMIDVADEAKYCQKYYGKIIQLINASLYFLSKYH